MEALATDNFKGMVLLAFLLVYDGHGLKCFKGQIWVPILEEICKKLLEETHKSWYSIHPDTNKLYIDLRQSYEWYNMKKGISL